MFEIFTQNINKTLLPIILNTLKLKKKKKCLKT